MSTDDNKRVIQSDGVSMLAYGHKEASATDVFGTRIVQKSWPKMDNLKPISHKGFNKFIKCKECKGRNNHASRNLEVKFGFKPLVEWIVLAVSLEGMEPTKFDSMRKATEAIGVGEGVIRYPKTMGKISLGDLRAKTSRCFP